MTSLIGTTPFVGEGIDQFLEIVMPSSVRQLECVDLADGSDVGWKLVVGHCCLADEDWDNHAFADSRRSNFRTQLAAGSSIRRAPLRWPAPPPADQHQDALVIRRARDRSSLRSFHHRRYRSVEEHAVITEVSSQRFDEPARVAARPAAPARTQDPPRRAREPNSEARPAEPHTCLLVNPPREPRPRFLRLGDEPAAGRCRHPHDVVLGAPFVAAR